MRGTNFKHTIQSAHQLYHLLDEPSFNIQTIRVCSEDVMEVVTTQAEEENEKSVKTNILIAVFTTAHAHLKLHEALETLQECVLYYDTDSVVYRWRPSQAESPLGVFLGEFTDECKGDRI